MVHETTHRVPCANHAAHPLVHTGTDAFAGYDLHRLGFITKDDLRALFGAYFALSMEIVRDLVNALEEEMVHQGHTRLLRCLAPARRCLQPRPIPPAHTLKRGTCGHS